MKKASRLAVKQWRISMTPTIELLVEAPPRQGFLEPAAFERVVQHLPEDLRHFVRFGYVSSRRKGEIRQLAWTDVDRAAGRIVLQRTASRGRSR